MEVHHHPNIEKKNFKEYFLEFLMIFLAVTMGFFAETIRESFTEHQHARDFASSLLKDLETDTAQLKEYKAYFNYAANNADTLIQLLTQDVPGKIPSGRLYWYGLFGGARRYFVPNDATFQQMKSSGALRFFEKNVARDVAKYDRLCRLMEVSEEMQRDIYTEVRKSRSQIFDYKYNERANVIYQRNTVFFDQKRIDSFMQTNPPLLSTDKVLFNQYVELVRSRFMHLKVSYADSLLIQANVLINALNKEYPPQNE